MTILQRQVSPAVLNNDHSIQPALAEVPVTSRPGSQEGNAGRYTSSPWEGLYWEADKPAFSVVSYETSASSTELDRFLVGLMCGE